MELSIEFFPPKTPEGEVRLMQTRERFSADLKPAFLFGDLRCRRIYAGGDTTNRTNDPRDR